MSKKSQGQMRAAAFEHPQIELRALTTLKPARQNARTHSAKQLNQIAKSIEAFGFVNPILVDADGRIVAGHGRADAARKLGLTKAPVICLEHLSQSELRAYALADNRLAELAGWDKDILALELADLVKIESDFDVSVTGFDHAEIDLTIQRQSEAADAADELPNIPTADEAITRLGTLWQMGPHRILCADVRDGEAVARLMNREKARMIFTDPPYNVPIEGHVSGLGRQRHREFAVGSGEMSSEEFTNFLEASLGNLSKASLDGALHYICMDWRHLGELLTAGQAVYTELKNLCVWNKTNGGMGSFYRSKHELVLVYKQGRSKHINNIELGRFGRYRSNVWDYAGANTWRKGRAQDLADHPTVKPVLLVSDALQDASNRGDIVLDGFGGAGTTLIAAERIGRRARLIELEPRYVDVAVMRWEKATGLKAVNADTGEKFAQESAKSSRRTTAETKRFRP